jgi:hypothetical protein
VKFPMTCTGVDYGRIKVTKLVISFYQIMLAKILASKGGRFLTSFYFPPKKAMGQ